MRRSSLVLAVLVTAAGLLSGCDLPGGSPAILGPDRVPNDSQEVAPDVGNPAVINGTVDANDVEDWYRMVSPPTERGLYLRCTGDAAVAIITQYESSAQSPIDDFCDGREKFIINVEPDATVYLLRSFFPEEGGTVQPYTIYAHYGSPGDFN